MDTRNKPPLFCWYFVCGVLATLVGLAGTNVHADHLFQHRNVVEDPYIPRLTREELVTRIDRQLFALPTSVSLSYFIDGDNYRPVTFATDLVWDRLCYYDRYATWIKVYGESEDVAEHELYSPLDICSNNGSGPNGSSVAFVFVLENGEFHNRILRLLYDHDITRLTYSDSLTVDTDEREAYRYLCLHDAGTMGSMQDDYLWVVDRYYGKLVKYNAFGEEGIQRTYLGTRGSNFGEIGSFGDIVCGRNPGTGENNNYIYLLDEANQRVVRFYDDGGDLIYDGNYESEDFRGLSSITADVYGQIYVAEKYIGRIWKFTPDLELLGVFDPGTASPDGLVNPVSITNAMGTTNYPGWAEIYVCEEYSDTSGGQWYQIGCKLLETGNPTISADMYSISIPYSASDPHIRHIEVFKKPGSEWVLFDTPDDLTLYSGASEATWRVKPEDEGQNIGYKFVITGSSTYEDSNGDPIDQFEFEVIRYFGNQNPQITDPIHIEGWEGEDCITYRDEDHIYDDVEVRAVDEEDGTDLVYHWCCTAGTFHFPPPDGVTCYLGGRFIKWFPPEGGTGAPTFGRIIVTADDQHGGKTRDTVEFELDEYCNPDPPPCPTLYVYGEKGYKIDNNVLSASEDTAQVPGLLIDPYLLRLNPRVDDKGCIHLQLREDDRQVTTFDEISLAVAWVDEGREIGVSDRGMVFYPVEVSTPVSVIDASGTDRLAQVDEEDGNAFVDYSPGKLIVNFGKLSRSGMSVSAFAEDPGGGEFPPPDKEHYRISPYADLSAGNILRVDVKDETGTWVKAGIVPPQRLPGMRYLQLSDWVKQDEDLWIRLRWDYSYRIDHLAYYRFDTEGMTVEQLPLTSVSHSALGDERAALTNAGDQATTELRPGETISLTFGPIPQAPPGKVARYVLTCTGRYETEELIAASNPSTPESNSLDQNSPNPFNEGTIISFSLAQDGPIRLEIYDILGRRVTTLVDRNQAAGRHAIRWDGRDRHGKPVASGIYFYRLSAREFAESRKMILLK